MAWHDLDEANGGKEFEGPYRRSLEAALATHDAFLPGHSELAKVVDRLHAYLYFLEGMLPSTDDPRCAAATAAGIERVASHVAAAAAAGHLERTDVYAQLLRMRLYAAAGGVAPLDAAAAEREAGLLREFSRGFARRSHRWRLLFRPPGRPLVAARQPGFHRVHAAGPGHVGGSPNRGRTGPVPADLKRELWWRRLQPAMGRRKPHQDPN